MESILLIDREPDVLDLLGHHLSQAGYRVFKASLGMEGLGLMETEMPDLVIMELTFTDMSGFEILEHIKADTRWRLVPIMVLSARGTVQDRIDGLSRGADDYLTKPFSCAELVLRARSLLRRSAAARSFVRKGPFLVDRNGFRCFLHGKPLDLTSTEYRILTKLLDHDGRTLERKSLVEHVWHQEEEAPSRSLDTHMKRLRLKLGRYATAIRTIRNKGYRFVAPGT